jgi:hypothetical protein
MQQPIDLFCSKLFDSVVVVAGNSFDTGTHTLNLPFPMSLSLLEVNFHKPGRDEMIA